MDFRLKVFYSVATNLSFTIYKSFEGVVYQSTGYK